MKHNEHDLCFSRNCSRILNRFFIRIPKLYISEVYSIFGLNVIKFSSRFRYNGLIDDKSITFVVNVKFF